MVAAPGHAPHMELTNFFAFLMLNPRPTTPPIFCNNATMTSLGANVPLPHSLRRGQHCMQASGWFLPRDGVPMLPVGSGNVWLQSFLPKPSNSTTVLTLSLTCPA